jgi:multiple antibiotic resistance protein
MLDVLHLDLFGAALAGFFAIMNPVANTPIFLGLTQGLSPTERRAVASKATFVAFWVVVVFAVLGQVIFSVFGITSGAFRIAGGVVVFLIGYRMLQGEHSALHHTRQAREAAKAGAAGLSDGSPAGSSATTAEHAEGQQPAVPVARDSDVGTNSEDTVLSVAVSPLAVPLLAGPGTIATAVGFSAGHWDKVVVTVTAFGILCLATWMSFRAGERIVRALGPAFLTVVTRLMGLILAVIGVQMLLQGWHESGL